jgi:hypothetical protein
MLIKPRSSFIRTVYVFKLNTATIRWNGYSHMNTSLHSEYNLSLKCGDECFETTKLYNISRATLSHLTAGRTYRVKVQALSKTGELIFGAAAFYSPGKIKKRIFKCVKPIFILAIIFQFSTLKS